MSFDMVPGLGLIVMGLAFSVLWGVYIWWEWDRSNSGKR